jgi:hypothetical protein
VTLVVVVLYAGAIIGYPYYQYVMMKQAVEEAADAGMARVGTIRKASGGETTASREVTGAVTGVMQAQATRLGLDLPARAVQVLLEPGLFRVLVNWKTEASLPGYTQRFRFGVEARRVLAQ